MALRRHTVDILKELARGTAKAFLFGLDPSLLNYSRNNDRPTPREGQDRNCAFVAAVRKANTVGELLKELDRI